MARFSSVSWSIAAVLLVLSLPRATHAQTQVTTCGQAYTGLAYLVGDLDCSSSGEPFAVRLQGGATLDLAGFTLTSSTAGVLCDDQCTVLSSVAGGAIEGAGGFHFGVNAGRARILGVEIRGFQYGIYAFGLRGEDILVEGNERGIECHVRRLLLRRAVVRDNSLNGVIVDGGLSAVRAAISDSTITGNGTNGIVFGSALGKKLVKIDGTEISGNGSSGIADFTVATVRDSVIDGNGAHGLDGFDARIAGSEITGNQQIGVHTVRATLASATVTMNGVGGIGDPQSAPCDLDQKVRTKDSTISLNGEWGIWSCRPQLVASTLSGNGTAAGCGSSLACADVASELAPALSDGATCQTSYVAASGIPGSNWGVCAAD